MLRLCAKCGVPLRTGDVVKLTVIAEYQELRSKVHYSISKPIDAEIDTLQHMDCPYLTGASLD
jgi:hypothetical protein